jgi:hypothetical protein
VADVALLELDCDVFDAGNYTRVRTCRAILRLRNRHTRKRASRLQELLAGCCTSQTRTGTTLIARDANLSIEQEVDFDSFDRLAFLYGQSPVASCGLGRARISTS